MEMVESVDVDCAMNILGKQAVDIAQKTGMDNARSRVHQVTVEMLKFAKSGAGQTGGTLTCPALNSLFEF